MHLDDRKISVSLATLELKPAGTDTRLVMTEQGAFLDGYDDAGSRQTGSNFLLVALDVYLKECGGVHFFENPQSFVNPKLSPKGISMALTLYAHPFASYCWKPLIALYENATPFTYRLVEDSAGWAELESIWPIKKFPLLRDGDATIVESSIIVEYLMRRYPGTTRMIPVNDDAALTVRFMDRFFDNYVMSPMQTLVSDRMRTETERDARGVADARKM